MFLLRGLCKLGGRTDFRTLWMKEGSGELLTRETHAHADNDVWGGSVRYGTLSPIPSLYPARASARSILVSDAFVPVDGGGACKGCHSGIGEVCGGSSTHMVTADRADSPS